MHPLLPLLLLPLACDPKAPDTASPETGPTDSPPHTGDTSTHPPDTSPPDTSPPDDTALPAPEAPVSGISAAVHPEVATILQVSWTQDEDADEAWLTWTFEDDTWYESPPRPAPAGPQEEVILGVPELTEVTFYVMNRRGDDVLASALAPTATTGAIPEDLLRPTLVSWNPDLASPEPWILSSIDVGDGWYQGPFYVFILDRKGRYVWYRSIPDSACSLFAQVAADGTHLLLDATTNWIYDPDVTAFVERTTLDGGWRDRIDLPHMGFTFDEIDGGVILYGRGSEALVERQPDGTEREVWSCVDWMESHGGSSRTCDPNSVVWNPLHGSVFWSMYNSDTIVEIDLATGTVLRQMGQLPGGWDFDPPETVVDYQHYPSLTPEGHLIASTHMVGARGEQYAREWAFDDDAHVLREVWHYGEEVVPYADYGGEAFRLPNGNTFICYGTGGADREITMDRKTAWEVTWPADPNTHLVGHHTLLADLYALNAGPAVTP